MTTRRHLVIAATAALSLSASLLAAPSATAEPTPAPTSIKASVDQQRPATVDVDARGPFTVPEADFGQGFTVTGRVRLFRKHKRMVTLKETVPGRLQKVGKTKTTKKGRFTFRVPGSTSQDVRVFQLSSPKKRGVKKYSKKFMVKIREVIQPSGLVIGLDKGETQIAAAPIFASGTVSGAAIAGRTVLIEDQLADGVWYEVARATTNPDGTWGVALPGHFSYVSTIRATVTAIPGHAAATVAPGVVAVRPNWAMSGIATDWSHIEPGYRIRWNPCQPIRYRVNYANAPVPDARAQVAAAVDHIHAATGLNFVDAGDTAAMPWPAPGSGLTGWDGSSELLIGFARHAQTTQPLAGTVLGRGGVDKSIASTDAYGLVYRSVIGGLVIDIEDSTAWTPALFRFVVTHELGHVMGMGHAAGIEQIMYPTTAGGITGFWGAGDFTALNSQLGRAAGCIRPYGSVSGRAALNEDGPGTVVMP